jgi:MFS family permease
MRESLVRLLTQRAFLPLFITQFLSAFNDNAFKLAMLTMISYFLTSSQAQSEQYQAIASAIFILPFFLFSATAGELADRFDKAYITKIIKLFEVVLMSIGGIALYLGNIILMMLVLGGLGMHSTFFGPIKYAILPDHLQRHELLGATALIEASTFLAILLGTTFGTLSVSGVKSGSLGAILLTFMAAFVGFIASLFIPTARTMSEGKFVSHWNVWRSTRRLLKQVFKTGKILPVVLTISWFWLVGIVIMTKLPDYTNYLLRAETSVFAFFMALFSIGIGVGSLTTNYFLAGRITLRYVPYAMVLLSFFTADLYWATPIVNRTLPLQNLSQFFGEVEHIRIALDLFFISFSGGLFVVPLYTFLQVASIKGMRARTIAMNNICNALFIVGGTILVMVLLYFRVSIPQVFFLLAISNILAAFLFWWFAPDNNT